MKKNLYMSVCVYDILSLLIHALGTQYHFGGFCP